MQKVRRVVVLALIESCFQAKLTKVVSEPLLNTLRDREESAHVLDAKDMMETCDLRGHPGAGAHAGVRRARAPFTASRILLTSQAPLRMDVGES